MAGQWGSGDPLADLKRSLEEIGKEIGFTLEVLQGEVYYCYVCQVNVVALVAIRTGAGRRQKGNPFCPGCQCTWPVLVKRRGTCSGF